MPRLLSATTLGLALTAVHATAARGNHSLLEGETGLAGGSVLLALIVSVLTALVCFGLMMWNPQKRESRRSPDAHE